MQRMHWPWPSATITKPVPYWTYQARVLKAGTTLSSRTQIKWCANNHFTTQCCLVKQPVATNPKRKSSKFQPEQSGCGLVQLSSCIIYGIKGLVEANNKGVRFDCNPSDKSHFARKRGTQMTPIERIFTDTFRNKAYYYWQEGSYVGYGYPQINLLRSIGIWRRMTLIFVIVRWLKPMAIKIQQETSGEYPKH